MKLFSNTNWNLYRSFIVVYEAGSYLKAVAILNMARQNIKANITTLSGQLGVELFKSHTKGVTPTDEAVRLYSRVKSLFSELASAEDEVKVFKEDSYASIRMIMATNFASTFLKKFFKQFNEKYPNIQLEFFNRADNESYNLFLLGNVDLVVDLEHALKEHWLHTVQLVTCKHIFIATKGFLTENNLNQTIDVDDLPKYKLIAHKENIKMITRENNFTPTVFLKTATLDPILPLVELGTGIGIYPKEYLDERDDFIELKSEIKIPDTKIACGYNQKTASQATKIFVNELIKFCS